MTEIKSNITCTMCSKDILYCSCKHSPRTRIEQLEKENAELKEKVAMCDFFAEGCGFKKRGLKTSIQISEYIDKLEATIQKMKCCRNCKYFEDESDEVPCDVCGYTYKKWELEE